MIISYKKQNEFYTFGTPDTDISDEEVHQICCKLLTKFNATASDSIGLTDGINCYECKKLGSAWLVSSDDRLIGEIRL